MRVKSARRQMDVNRHFQTSWAWQPMQCLLCLFFCVLGVHNLLFLVVSTSAINCLERLVFKMTFYVSSGPLNPTHSLACCQFSLRGHRLPLQPHSITASLAINKLYTAWWRRQTGVNNLPRVVAQWRLDRESNPWIFYREFDALYVAPPYRLLSAEKTEHSGIRIGERWLALANESAATETV